jgi:hypothetical protein
VLSARADIDAAMAGRMAGRRHEPKRIVELIAVVDEQCLAGFDDRLAIVAKHIAAAAGCGFRRASTSALIGQARMEEEQISEVSLATFICSTTSPSVCSVQAHGRP